MPSAWKLNFTSHLASHMLFSRSWRYTCDIDMMTFTRFHTLPRMYIQQNDITNSLPLGLARARTLAALRWLVWHSHTPKNCSQFSNIVTHGELRLASSGWPHTVYVRCRVVWPMAAPHIRAEPHREMLESPEHLLKAVTDRCGTAPDHKTGTVSVCGAAVESCVFTAAHLHCTTGHRLIWL